MKKCANEECDRPSIARGLCGHHYNEARKNGMPLINKTQPDICQAPDCGRPVHDLVYCGGHAARFRKGQDLTAPWKKSPQRRADKCSVDNCDREIGDRGAKGMCSIHAQRAWKHGNPLTLLRSPRTGKCNVEGCQNPDNGGKGLCDMHAQRKRTHGDPLITLTPWRGQHERRINKKGYAIIYIDGKPIKEHRAVMERMERRPLLTNEEPHHKNGIRSDNSPRNLELWVKGSHRAGQRASDLIAYVMTYHREAALAFRV